METKILLNKNNSKFSVNNNSFINLDLESKSRLIPFNSISENLSLRQLYNDERDNCEKYRMIFTINPICSNVLYNSKTEVVRYEGSDKCVVLNDNSRGDRGHAVNTSNLNAIQAIRDTEYTHPDLFNDKTPYVYHCGFDIFNNHMLRNDDFVFVNKISSRDKTNFNTIKDKVRDTLGKNVQENVTLGSSGQTLKDIHIYQYDTILSMYDAFVNRLKVKDGWYGFYNSTNIAIPNATIKGNQVSINKIMNNNKACEFIDLYPDRTLYSFIPKVNKYRRRVEKNWDYCITYPKSKDSKKVSEVCGVPTGITENNGGASIKIIDAKRTYSNSGNNLVQFKTMFRHNLKPGDCITLFFIDKDNENNLLHFNNKIKVISVGKYDGSEEEHYFSIQFKDISIKFDFIGEGFVGTGLVSNDIVYKGTSTKAKFFYKKNVNGVDCQYYFRKFKAITKEDSQWLDSDVNKLAYGENIYGDRVAQVVFTDDIDIEGLVDHRGRPLTELYFTVIKRNAGHTLWYDSNVYNTPSVEFSHCFGKVTTGIDLPIEETKYNIRKIHNVNITEIPDYNSLFSKSLQDSYNACLENDITINSYNGDGIYGDIVEYEPVNDSETVLEVVQHRFNTAQRETLNSNYAKIWYDDIIADDYDTPGGKTDFTVSSYTINKSSYVIFSGSETTILEKTVPGNINPEGYYYNPYTKIKIKELDGNVSKVVGKQIKFSNITNKSLVLSGTTYNGFMINNTSIDYNVIKNDVLAIYNNESKDLTWGTIYEVDGNNIWVISENTDIVYNTDKYSIIKFNEGVPPYACYLPSSHSFVWRNIVLMSELSNDSTLYNMPFVNGRNYIEQNVTFFLKRQDPTGEYGLLNYDKDALYKSRLNSYKIKGWNPVDLSSDLFNNGGLGKVCY